VIPLFISALKETALATLNLNHKRNDFTRCLLATFAYSNHLCAGTLSVIGAVALRPNSSSEPIQAFPSVVIQIILAAFGVFPLSVQPFIYLYASAHARLSMFFLSPVLGSHLDYIRGEFHLLHRLLLCLCMRLPKILCGHCWTVNSAPHSYTFVLPYHLPSFSISARTPVHLFCDCRHDHLHSFLRTSSRSSIQIFQKCTYKSIHTQVLNNIGVLDMHLLQRFYAEYQVQVYHIVGLLVPHCTAHIEDGHIYLQLLEKMVLSVGYCTLNNPGTYPT
jgi:hypothetical protein